MNVEELQSIWNEMSAELEKQKRLTHEIIIKMTKERYKGQLQKIAKYEGVGALVCFGAAVFILLNFDKLDTWYLMVCGAFTMMYLLVLPIMVLRSIQNMRRIDISEGNYTDNLQSFTKARDQFLFLQRIGIGLAFLLILTTLPVAGKLMNNKDIFMNSELLIWYMPVMIVFLVVFSRWGYKAYKDITQSAENILREVEPDN